MSASFLPNLHPELMISEYLNRDIVLKKVQSQRDKLSALEARLKARDPKAAALLKKHKITRKDLGRAIAALDHSLAQAAADKEHGDGGAYIPRDVLTCALQAAWTRQAIKEKRVKPVAKKPAPPAMRGGPRAAAKKPVEDTSPRLQLAKAPVTRAQFVESDDARYGLEGFWSKLGGLFSKRRKFNPRPARKAASTKPLRLFLFGDWGTGLPLADLVTKAVRAQIDAGDGSRQQHVVHLGDVYYVGEADEYQDRMLKLWPVKAAEKSKIGSWSLNGNHDMYSGGHGYFDTLLAEPRFLAWHRDESGKPSSFFLIEDANWQIFGLDTSWNLPSLGSAVFGAPTLEDYGGMNGILTPEQVAWMKTVRNTAKGCVLLTHHQASSSRTNEKQHSDEAIAALKKAGLYAKIDAWIWGHEHRGVVFKPKGSRVDPRLKDAPALCACIGHSGVPVPARNFSAKTRKRDVAWEEDRLGADAPTYEGERVVPFGFARIDTAPGKLEFRVFDHRGVERFKTSITR